tara:strand:- start:542 stop:856 length:315 start_codon:yes stop_codon:yes gene_type:complete
MKKNIAIVISVLLWCSCSYAGLLTSEELKYNLQACKEGQYASQNNQGISKNLLDKYCVCYVNKIDESLTKKDLEYFKKNRRYPERFNTLVFEASKQCYLKVIAK